MHRRFVHALLVCVALTLALIVPLRARAAILPACENRELLTLAPAQAPAPAPSILFADVPPEIFARPTLEQAPEPSCDDPGGDPKAAPICDPRGASAVAPPRVVPVSDDRIEAAPGCEIEAASPMIGPAPRSATTLHAAASLVEHATTAAIDMVPPAPSELGPAYPPVTGESRAGVERGVYHPPR